MRPNDGGAALKTLLGDGGRRAAVTGDGEEDARRTGRRGGSELRRRRRRNEDQGRDGDERREGGLGSGNCDRGLEQDGLAAGHDRAIRHRRFGGLRRRILVAGGRGDLGSAGGRHAMEDRRPTGREQRRNQPESNHRRQHSRCRAARQGLRCALKEPKRSRKQCHEISTAHSLGINMLLGWQSKPRSAKKPLTPEFNFEVQHLTVKASAMMRRDAKTLQAPDEGRS